MPNKNVLNQTVVYNQNTLLEPDKLKSGLITKLIPDNFKKSISNLPSEKLSEMNPNAVSTLAFILDRVIEDATRDWEILPQQLFEEFQLKDVLDKALNLYGVKESELIKGFFTYKGTKYDIAYILKTAGYNLKIYDYQRIDREMPQGFFKEDDIIYFKNKYGLIKEVRSCELYAVIETDTDDINYTGVNTNILEKIRTIIESRLLVCIHLSKLDVNILFKDTVVNELFDADWQVNINKIYEDKVKIWSSIYKWDAPFSRWDNESIQWLGDNDYEKLVAERHKKIIEKVLNSSDTWDSGLRWDKVNTRWDNTISDSKLSFIRRNKQGIIIEQGKRG